MFGARELVVDRKTSGTIFVPNAAVSLIGGIQPGILARYVGQEHRDNGLLARLLVTMPPRRPKRWTEAEIAPEVQAAIAGVFRRLYELAPDWINDEWRAHIIPLTPTVERRGLHSMTGTTPNKPN